MNNVMEQLGENALRNGEYQEGINIYRRALESGTRPSLYRGLGKAYYHLGDFSSARWAFRKTLELSPGDVTSRKYLGLIEEKGRQSVAIHGRKVPFRIGGDRIEHNSSSGRKFFIKGVNLGLALPGYFPGDFPVKRGTYLRWFKEMALLGINTVRTYALHPPSFYEALKEFNLKGRQLYLLQGIWFPLPGDNRFENKRYMDLLVRRMKEAVDAVHGRGNIEQRTGRPSGHYVTDVSPFTIAFIAGREWGSCEVRAFNTSREKPPDFHGNYLLMADPSPFEAWILSFLDGLIKYENEKYGSPRPVSTVTWPTLDPLVHISESEYESEVKWQGGTVPAGICNEDEDVVSLDFARVKAKGPPGFFPTYHVYPYYPDFMNNDPSPRGEGYRRYLERLKKHHNGQPLLIGEFGVPSSRESAHWHRDGYHQGSHNERAQGNINGKLINDIHDTGLAGGVLFGWFDEWYKRNWLFLPYETPPDRNRFWFNHQDPEQNFGLIGAYPGYPSKKVTLSGNRDEWRSGQLLYEKEGGVPTFPFGDGRDGSRTLTGMRALHDEGFLYLMIETARDIDFNVSNFLIGLSTGGPESGEFLIPFCKGCVSPVALTFLIHLCGKKKSRILACSSYDRHTNGNGKTLRPQPSREGRWVMMMSRTNARRISRNGKHTYPPRVRNMSRLRFGSLKEEHVDFDSLSDFHVSGRMLELRIPWGLINFTDPSSKTILWREGKRREKSVEGIGITALSFAPENRGFLARETGTVTDITDQFPRGGNLSDVKTYTWEGWEVPLFHLYRKESFHLFRQALAGIPEGV
jgi:hypothetical protein